MNPSNRFGTSAVLSTIVLLVAGLPAAAQDYGSNLMCNSTNAVAVTKLEIWCERQCGDSLGCQGLVATYLGGPSCAGVGAPDGSAKYKAVPQPCVNPCKRTAYVYWTCNGVPKGPVCMDVPAPGSGKAASVGLSCGPSPLPDAVFLLFEGSPPSTYCSGKVNSLGCTPKITLLGAAILSSPNPFLITATQVINDKNGLMFYGSGAASLPFQGGTLCVQPPVTRTAGQNSGGSPPPTSDCSGSFSLDFNAYLASGVDPTLTAGTSVHVQFWGRDPALPAGQQSQLSDAAGFPILP